MKSHLSKRRTAFTSDGVVPSRVLSEEELDTYQRGGPREPGYNALLLTLFAGIGIDRIMMSEPVWQPGAASMGRR